MLRRLALVRTTLRNVPEDGIHHSHRRESLKSYENLNVYTNFIKTPHSVSNGITARSSTVQALHTDGRFIGVHGVGDSVGSAMVEVHVNGEKYKFIQK
jgi:hypothetical protein